MENEFKKICGLCGCFKEHAKRFNKKGIKVMTGKKCISCNSKGNNIKLKNKEYYKNYYVDNIETFKTRDSVRYQVKKLLKLQNTVVLDIEIENANNIIIEDIIDQISEIVV